MTTRSERQLASIRHAQDWHLRRALQARLEDLTAEYEFHMRHYMLLGPAVEAGGLLAEPPLSGKQDLGHTFLARTSGGDGSTQLQS